MKNSLKIIIGLLLVLIITATSVYLLLFVSKITPALLIPQEGIVEVNSGEGFTQIITETALGINDVIKTGAQSTAIVLLHESVIITLDPNTQITLAQLETENLVVTQETGSTWNKFTRLNGVSTYSIKTPTSTATVRGTEFRLTLSELLVAEGTVSLHQGEQSIQVASNQKVQTNQKTLNIKEIDQNDIPPMIKQMTKQIIQLKQMRARELAQHKTAVNTFYTQLAQSNEAFKNKRFDELLQDVDSGKIDLQETRSAVPIKSVWIDNVFNLSQQIQDQNANIGILQNRASQK